MTVVSWDCGFLNVCVCDMQTKQVFDPNIKHTVTVLLEGCHTFAAESQMLSHCIPVHADCQNSKTALMPQFMYNTSWCYSQFMYIMVLQPICVQYIMVLQPIHVQYIMVLQPVHIHHGVTAILCAVHNGVTANSCTIHNGVTASSYTSWCNSQFVCST